jgi:4-hydroxybenzoate polyprenyltransferase
VDFGLIVSVDIRRSRELAIIGARRAMPDFFASFLHFARDIKISHSVFALPFAASAIFLGRIEIPPPRLIFLLVVCMVAARSFAMGFNRLVDRVFDKANPRTRNRALPSGRLQVAQGVFWTVAAGVVLIFAAFQLNERAGLCSFPLLLVLAIYSLMKRFSWLCHFYLGICLGLAPVAVLVALDRPVASEILLLALAISLWTGGFDIIYSLQDREFDSKVGLQSVPTVFGVKAALWISRVSFLLMFLILNVIGFITDASIIYTAMVFVIGIVLVWEHWRVRASDEVLEQNKVNGAFFNGNALVSLLFLLGVIFDVVYRRLDS